MTTLKLAGKPASAAMQALEPHVRRLYDKPGLRVMAIVEFAHTERMQPAPGSDKDQSVSVKITACEVPTGDQEGQIREAQRALFLARTARGTLDEAGQLQLDDTTLKLLPGLLMSTECARLRAGLAHWNTYARRIVSQSQKLTQTEMTHELLNVADGLQSVLQQAEEVES